MLQEVLPEVLPAVPGEGVQSEQLLVEDVSYRSTPQVRVQLTSLVEQLVIIGKYTASRVAICLVKY